MSTVPAPTNPRPASDMLTAIQRSLSLSITELARLFRVERTAIYSWIKGTTPRKREAQEQLEALYCLAKLWSERGNGPLGSWRLCPVEDEHSLLDLLEAEEGGPFRATNDFSAIFDALERAQGSARNRGSKSSLKEWQKDRRRKAKERGMEEEHAQKSCDEFEAALSNLHWFGV